MIIDLNELRSKLRFIPDKCDKAEINFNSSGNVLLLVAFNDNISISHYIYLQESSDE